MLVDEAREIRAMLSSLGAGGGRVCLNIGSSTAEFREQVQPHIHSEILAPLQENGWSVVNVDLKPDAGVDLSGDLMDPAFRSQLKEFDAKLLLCSNLLEHVTRPEEVIEACAEVIAPDGFCLISVPRSYPYHPDPLDTLYRPSPSELAGLLPEWKIVEAREIDCGGLVDELRMQGSVGSRLARLAVRSLLPFYKPASWRASAHALLWLIRRYRVSVVLLSKQGLTSTDPNVVSKEPAGAAG